MHASRVATHVDADAFQGIRRLPLLRMAEIGVLLNDQLAPLVPHVLAEPACATRASSAVCSCALGKDQGEKHSLAKLDALVLPRCFVGMAIRLVVLQLLIRIEGELLFVVVVVVHLGRILVYRSCRAPTPGALR